MPVDNNSIILSLKKYTIFVLTLIVSLNSSSQNTDSLEQTFIKKINKTIVTDEKIYHYVKLARKLRKKHPENSKKYLENAQSLLSKSSADSIHYMFNLNIGNYNMDVGSKSKLAADYFGKSLKFAEKMNDSSKISAAYYQLGLLNFYQGDLKLTEKYFNNSSDFLPVSADITVRTNINSALGAVYSNNNNPIKSDSLFLISIRLAKQAKDTINLALAYGNLAEIKWSLKQQDSAFIYLNLSKKLNHLTESQPGIAWVAYLESNFYNSLKQWKKADKSMQQAIFIWERDNSLKDLAYAYKPYAEIKAALGDYQAAYNLILKDKTTNDSIKNKENIKYIQELEKKYESEKSDLELANIELQLKQEKNEREQEKNAENRRLILFVILGIAMIINIIYFLSRYLKMKKAKNIIQFQNDILEEKNKEITDSLNYAKRIQDSIIPSDKKMKSTFPNSFVYYQPKDIVAGDFYILEKVGDWTFCAVADCTGHGVPGAMVSVICANALHKAIVEQKIIEPSKILDTVRKIVAEQFMKSDENINDGMDITLCAFNLAEKKLQWAGANNPIWIFREQELIEIKGDKQPIGKFSKEKPFTNHQLDLKSNDLIYLFTDGYADQFGGQNGKKMKVKNFKTIISRIQNEPIQNQNEIIVKEFNNWKGNLEQLDDVCVMGIQV